MHKASIFHSAIIALAFAGVVPQAEASGGCNRKPGDYLGRDGRCHQATGASSHKHKAATRHRAAPKTSASAINPMRAQQQALCDQQAAKRRALGIPSVVVWDNQFTCRATGGMVQTGRI